LLSGSSPKRRPQSGRVKDSRGAGEMDAYEDYRADSPAEMEGGMVTSKKSILFKTIMGNSQHDLLPEFRELRFDGPPVPMDLVEDPDNRHRVARRIVR